MFDQIDKEEDGMIYIKDVLFYLKALSNDLDQNKEVKHGPSVPYFLCFSGQVNDLFTDYEEKGEKVVDLKGFEV